MAQKYDLFYNNSILSIIKILQRYENQLNTLSLTFPHIFYLCGKIFLNMLLKQLKTLFHQELATLYTPSECTELLAIFSEKYLGFNKILFNLNADKLLSELQKTQFSDAIALLKTGKPYQQILGEAEFFGKKFFVNENVLIPRPETEELVEIAISKLKNSQKKLRILDIGSGSGCIPISLALHFPNSEITSIDISEKALKIAKKNNDFHQTKVHFLQKDYLNENLEETYDVIVSNPPYIDTLEEIEIPFSVKNFEPHLALFAPQNRALAFYEKIAQDCEKHLSENGFLFLEINQKLGKETLHLFQNFSEIDLIKDLSGNDRFIVGRK